MKSDFLKNMKGQKQNPDWRENSMALLRMFPDIYPCADCSRNETCANHTSCMKYRKFLNFAWEDTKKLLRGEKR